MTLWPGVPVPLPPLFCREHCQLDQSGRAVIEWGPTKPVERERGEIYLRLWDLDLDDPQAIVTFTSRYGSLDPQTMSRQLDEPGLYRHVYVFRDVIERDPSFQALHESGEAGFIEVTPLADFVEAARFLRDITTAWRILNEDRTLSPERAQWEHIGYTGGEVSRDAALAVIHDRFSPLLRQFALAFDFRPESEEEQHTPVTGPLEITPTRGPSDSLRLHEICALELFNHIAGREIYRDCNNETCGRAFVTQYGRSEHGMSKRKGVLYCSAACAQAQASREYRRRRRNRESSQQAS